MKTSRPKFAWLLPMSMFLLTLVALAVPTSIMYLRMLNATRGGAPSVWMHSKTIDLTVDRQDILSFAVNGTAAWEQKAITGLNVPGMFGEVLVSLPTTWPASWHPANIPLFSWRSFSIPIFCLPFWWFVGVGLDRFFAKHHTHWSVLLAGTLLSAFMLFIAIGLNVMGVIEKDNSIYPQIAGLYLWAILFSIFPTLWLAQRRWQSR